MNKPYDSVFTMPVAELEKRVEQGLSYLTKLRELFPGLAQLTDLERRHSDGRLRDGEADALSVVLDIADEQPQYFTALADKDGGIDPNAFETDFLRDQIARRQLLAKLAATGEELAAPLGDTVLTLGGQVRPVLLAAYAIAKSVAAVDPKLRAKLAPVIDFYSRIGRRGAQTRQAAKEPNNGTPGPEPK